MWEEFLIGLDYGSEAARGALVDAASGEVVATCAHSYRYGVMTDVLPGRHKLRPDWALQNAPDYLEGAEVLLDTLGRGRNLCGIGLGFTASSPLPAFADGSPLSLAFPEEPHA